MEIHSIKFVKSSPSLQLCPKSHFPEYAFAGRSNVGKSSLINMVIHNKNLAKTSSTPGKTRFINHFLVNDNWYLVDLPGYGYAQTSKDKRQGFSPMVGEYLLQRKSLACLFILIDCRHKPLKNDLEFIEWAGINQIPFVLVFTKCDKISRSLLENNLELYKDKLRNTWEILPDIFFTSAKQNEGDKSILLFIEETNKSFNQ